MVSLLALLIGPIVAVAIIVIYLVALKTRHYYTSDLTCPHCQRPFEYEWVPLVSFNTVRLGRERYMKCPLCNEWATFDIWSTRTDTSKGS